MVPTIAAILRQLDLGATTSGLRYITNTAAACRPRTSRAAHGAAARPALLDVRADGMQAGVLPAARRDRRAPDSVGRGMPNEEVYIVDEHGAALGPACRRARRPRLERDEGLLGAAGARPPGAEAGRSARRDASLHTGDLFTGRGGLPLFHRPKDDIIKTRGEKVSPREVENVLHSLPGVPKPRSSACPTRSSARRSRR